MMPVQSTNDRTKRLPGFVIAAMVALALVFGAYASAQDDSSGEAEGDAAATSSATLTGITVANSADYGDYLTDAEGRSMYIFLNDTNGMSNCTDDCIANWPAVTVSEDTDLSSLSGDLDASLLSTYQRDDGTIQLVYNGWPLYYYVGDAAAGDVTGQGVGDVWYLVTPMGTGAGIESGQPGGDAAP